MALRAVRSVERSLRGRSRSACRPVLVAGLAFDRRASRECLTVVWLERGTSTTTRSRSAHDGSRPNKTTEVAGVAVIIGVDPHKASHTAVAIDGSEEEVVRKKVRAGVTQVDQLVSWAEPLGSRTWAIESAGGLGYLLSQQLVAAGETVVDVPATLASRVRVLATGRSNKNDPNDALSVAVAALRFRGLRQVAPAGHGEVLRLLAKRNIDIGSQRTRLVCRMHALVAELAPGGIAKEINASDIERLLETLHPATPVERVRYDLAVELLDDIRRLDYQLKVSHKRIRDAVRASATSLTDLFGVGPIIAQETS